MADSAEDGHFPVRPRIGMRRRAVALTDDVVRIRECGETFSLPMAEALIDGLDLRQWASGNADQVERQLDRHGALLFRGFSIVEAMLEETVRSVSGELFEYSFRSTPRSIVKGRVYTSTEYPPDQSIPLHNEMSYAAQWPRRLWFLCSRPAQNGGATPLADGRAVRSAIPFQIRERFERLGVMYLRRYGPHLDLPWQECFQTGSRSEVDAECRRQGLAHAWLGDQRLVTRALRPASLRHSRSGDLVWFNQAHLFHPSSLPGAMRAALSRAVGEEELPRNALYGDGSPIEDDAIAAINSAYEACALDVNWRRSDILLVDNERIAHGRRPFAGSRRIVVAMAQPCALAPGGDA